MTAESKQPFAWHGKLERNITLLGVCALVAVLIGGIVEIAPLFWIDNTIEKVKGMRPYTPLEQGVSTSMFVKAATCATAR